MRKILFSTTATITLVAIASFLHAVKITDASFTLEHQAQSVEHKLRISFIADDKKTTIYTFAFQPITAIKIGNEAYCHYSRNCIDEGNPGIVDLWPVNATYCKRSFTHKLFSNNNTPLQELRKELEYLGTIETLKTFSPRLFVLDIKDKGGNYSKIEEIIKAENLVESFLVGYSKNRYSIHQNKHCIHQNRYNIHQDIKDGNVQYFLREGSLKAQLINNVFNATEINFLQKEKNGKIFLCQLCEFIMNGFKKGFLVTVNGYELQPAHFFSFAQKPKELRNVSKENKAMITFPEKFFTQPLCTLYSGTYEGVYSGESDYVATLRALCSIEHRCDDKITVIIQKEHEEKKD